MCYFLQTNHRFRFDIGLLCLDIQLAGKAEGIRAQLFDMTKQTAKDERRRDKNENRMRMKKQLFNMKQELGILELLLLEFTRTHFLLHNQCTVLSSAATAQNSNYQVPNYHTQADWHGRMRCRDTSASKNLATDKLDHVGQVG